MGGTSLDGRLDIISDICIDVPTLTVHYVKLRECCYKSFTIQLLTANNQLDSSNQWKLVTFTAHGEQKGMGGINNLTASCAITNNSLKMRYSQISSWWSMLCSHKHSFLYSLLLPACIKSRLTCSLTLITSMWNNYLACVNRLGL